MPFAPAEYVFTQAVIDRDFERALSGKSLAGPWPDFAEIIFENVTSGDLSEETGRSLISSMFLNKTLGDVLAEDTDNDSDSEEDTDKDAD